MMRIASLAQLSLISILLKNCIALSATRFPYEEFFGITSADIVYYSSYLCTINPEEPKCCTCDADKCFEDCCIDALWDEGVFSILAQYLHNNTQKYQTYAQYGTCQPLLPHLKDEHKTEYVTLQSRVYDHEAERVLDICPERPFTVPVHSFDKDMAFDSRECGVKNGAKDLLPLEIQVKCEEAFNISNGDLFTIRTQEEKLNKCVFLLENSTDSKNLNCEVNMPDACPKNKMYTDMCGSYYAPIGQYKNKHCKECVEGQSLNSARQEAPNAKCTCVNKQCSMPKPEYSYGDLTVSFKLVSKESYTIIDDIRHMFQPSEFFDGSDIGKAIDHTDHLCSFGNAKCCSCEPSCFVYKTCCMDILWNDSEKQNMSTYKELLINRSQEYTKDIKCEQLLPNIDAKKNAFYMMVSSCPIEANNKAKEMCKTINSSRLETFIPVLGGDKQLYRNKYCAHCNSVYLYDIVKIAVECKKQEQKIDETCKFQIHEENPFLSELKSCSDHIKDIDSYCNKNNKYYQLCKAYKSNYGRYKNYHCYLCNSTGFHQHQQKICTQKRSTFRWSMIINFNADVEVSTVNQQFKEDIKVCQGRSIFFDLSGNGLIQDNCNEQQQEIYEIAFNVTTPGFDACNSKTEFYAYHLFPGNVVAARKSYLFNVSINYSEPYYKNNDRVVYRSTGKTSLASILQQGRNIKTGGTYLFHTVQNPVLSELHDLDFSNAFNYGLCQDPLVLVQNAVNFTTSCGMIYDSRIFTSRQTSSWISVGNNGLQKHVTICRKFYEIPNCALTKLKGGEMIDKKTKLYKVKYKNIDKNFTIKEYYPLQQGIAVCSNIISQRRLLEIIVDTEGYITTIGTSISVVCYIAMLPLFLLLKTFKNLPGRCCLALTFNLLVADSMVLLASTLYKGRLRNMRSVCEGVGVIVHFGLTMVYSWGLAIAYDVMFRFSLMQPVSAHDMKRFKRYSLVTNLYSAIVVSFAFALDKLNIVLIGYGENGICAPNKFYGRLYFYVIPAIIAFVLSIGFIAFTLGKITSVIKIRKKVLRISRKEHMTTIIVAFKLILVLGLSEGIGFMQVRSSGVGDGAITFQAVCSLLYTSLRSLRGVFIFLVYICKMEVFNMWKQFVMRNFNRRKLDTSSSSVSGIVVIGNKTTQKQLVITSSVGGISDTRM